MVVGRAVPLAVFLVLSRRSPTAGRTPERLVAVLRPVTAEVAREGRVDRTTLSVPKRLGRVLRSLTLTTGYPPPPQ